MPYDVRLLLRFLGKLVRDILPPALASVIGGILFTHYQLGYAVTAGSVPMQGAPASAEMVRLIRDEHALIVDFLKARMAAEKNRLAEEDAARIAADAKPATAAAAPRRTAVGTVAVKPRTPGKPLGSAAPTTRHVPLAVAHARQNESAELVPQAEDSLLDKTIDETIDIKDHFVGATQRVVAVVGGIPSWIASMGERIGGQRTSSSAAPLFIASL